MLTTKEARSTLVVLNSAIISGTPGANIELPNGVSNVNAPIIIMFVHFFFFVQFRGFSGSSGPLQSTRFTSLVGTL